MARSNDNDPGKRKAVTNADEQDVAVNHSTAESGFDEPAQETQPEKSGNAEKPAQAESVDGARPGKDRSTRTPENL